MPGMDGAEFVKRLRTECAHPHCKVAIIMLTGHLDATIMDIRET
jgi:CheY-like chemotaxis protein